MWITLVNFFYLLTQMVIAVEDVGVRTAMRDAFNFVRVRLREVAGVFGIVLLLVVTATIASILATAGLGLIAFVPLVGIAVLPLRLPPAGPQVRLPIPCADRARHIISRDTASAARRHATAQRLA